VQVVPNYFERVKLEQSPIKEENIIRILTLGHVVFYKNPMLWIEVAEDVLAHTDKNIEFVWAGDGPLLQKCRNRVINNPSIKFVGFIKDVDSLYASADIYFQPSLLESQGMSVIGAMAHRIPCVVSNAGGLPESVEDGKNGWIAEPEDKSAFSQQILTLINNSRKRRQLGYEGEKIFNKKFDKSTWISRMDHLLQSHHFVAFL
jgi:glycosyltransferase involved in cell wall biosynthesis